MSRRPKRPVTSPTTRSTAAPSVMSQAKAAALICCRDVSSRATPSAWSRLCAYMTAICAPSFASAWQMRCPSPPFPPVTNATAPFSSMDFPPACGCTAVCGSLMPSLGAGKRSSFVWLSRDANVTMYNRIYRGALPMTRPFEGIRIIDITHVLAGPFAAYQLAVLGADVIKVEHPDEPDQSRETGTDRALNRRSMGTSFLTQGSNKRSITLDLKTDRDRDMLKKLVA